MDGDGRQSGQQNKSRMGSANRPVSRPKSNTSLGSDELQKLVDEEAGEQQNGDGERELKSVRACVFMSSLKLSHRPNVVV